VYDRHGDEILGIINDLQLLDTKNRRRKARQMVEAPVCIPENLELSRALIIMRMNFAEMAAVIDEYGGTVGIVTMKDIISEITGKLTDKYEIDPQGYIHLVSKNEFIADTLFRLDELEAKTGISFEGLPFETVGGLLNYILGRIPKKGDTVKYKNLQFKVLRSRAQKAEMVKITLKQ